MGPLEEVGQQPGASVRGPGHQPLQDTLGTESGAGAQGSHWHTVAEACPRLSRLMEQELAVNICQGDDA